MLKKELIYENLKSILKILPNTMLVSFIILIVGIFIGTFIAIIKIKKIPIIEKIASSYVSYIRGIPLIIHMYIVYYGFIKIINYFEKISNSNFESVNPLVVIIVVYSLYTSSTQSENIRSAIQSVGKGQFEACYSMGFTECQTFVRIILPQALAIALPMFFNVYLGIIKGLSIGFIIGFIDIMAIAKLNSAINFGYLESYIAAGLVYWALCLSLTILFNKIENYYKFGLSNRI